MNAFSVKTVLLFSVLLITNSSFSQEVELPEVTIPQLPKTGVQVQDFVPPGWGIELSESGDLGGDGSKKDHLLLLKMQDTHNILFDDEKCPAPLDTNPRLLVFLLGRNGHYFLAGQNSTLIPRPDSFCDGDDPIDGVTGGHINIDDKQGIIDLGFFGGSLGNKSFGFQWINRIGKVYLVSCHSYSRHRYSGATSIIEADYLKRQVRYEEIEFDENDYEKEIVTRNEIKPIFARPLIPLEEVNAYYHFDCKTMGVYK